MITGQIKQICSTGQVTLARRKPLGRIKPADLSSQESPVKATLFQGACRCTAHGTSRQKKEELRCLRWLWRLHLYYFSLSIHLKSRERGQGLQTGFSDIPVLPWQLLWTLAPVPATQWNTGIVEIQLFWYTTNVFQKRQMPSRYCSNPEAVTGQRKGTSLDWGSSVCQILTLYGK